MSRSKVLHWDGTGMLMSPSLDISIGDDGQIYLSLSTENFVIYVQEGRMQNTLALALRPEAARRLAKNLEVTANKVEQEAAAKTKAKKP